MTLYAGTSGWAYREWVPDFYPSDLPQRRWLEHYAGRFPACEANSTFRRIPPPGTFQRWADQTPESFRFALKGPLPVTYTKADMPFAPGPLIELADASEPLGTRRGPVLLQVPRFKKRDDDALGALLGTVPRLTVAVELVDESWHVHEVRRLVESFGAALCVTDNGGPPPPGLPDGPCAYVRLRGLAYDERQRIAWKTTLERESTGRDVYVFCRHKDVAPGDAAAGLGFAEWIAAASTRAIKGS